MMRACQQGTCIVEPLEAAGTGCFQTLGTKRPLGGRAPALATYSSYLSPQTSCAHVPACVHVCINAGVTCQREGVDARAYVRARSMYVSSLCACFRGELSVRACVHA
eukprot:3680231-Pleurochrysis_carterae.AAC.1